MCKKQKWLKPQHTQLIFVTTPPIDIWPTKYRTFCRRNLDSLLYSHSMGTWSYILCCRLDPNQVPMFLQWVGSMTLSPPSETLWHITTMGWNSPPSKGKSLSDTNRQLSRDVHNDLRGNSCAAEYTGGWWYRGCFDTRLTGLHYETSRNVNYKQIHYYQGGNRGNSHNGWAEAEMVLVPK